MQTETHTLLSADHDTLVIESVFTQVFSTGETETRRVKGTYLRVPETLAYQLVEEVSGRGRDHAAALPHGDACVLPSLLGRAVLVRAEKTARNTEIMAHELSHVLAHKHGLTRSDYSANEKLADKLGAQLNA